MIYEEYFSSDNYLSYDYTVSKDFLAAKDSLLTFYIQHPAKYRGKGATFITKYLLPHKHPAFQLGLQGFHNFLLEPGIAFPKKVYGGDGSWKHDYLEKKNLITANFLSISNEFRFGKDFVIGPKLSYSMFILLLEGKLSFVNYTNFKRNDFAIRPEIGYTHHKGYISFFYGRSFFFKKNILDLNRHNFTLLFRFPIWYGKYNMEEKIF